MRRTFASPLCLTLLAVLVDAQSSATSSQATATGTGTGLVTSQPTILSGTTVGPASATYTRLLPVPSYSFASSLSPDAAAAMQSNIPSYQYNLTMESDSTRVAICNQQTNFCQTAGCEQPTANVSTNFCNNQTMGWNCACSSGNSRLLLYQAPVQIFDCRLRSGRCLTACQDPASTPRVTNIAACTEACNDLIGQTCGQSNQITVNYKVNNPSDTPSYAGNTSSGGAAVRSAATVIGIATFLSISAGAAFVALHAVS